LFPKPLYFPCALFAAQRFFWAKAIRFRAASVMMRFFGVAAPALSAFSADIHLGGLPRRLPRGSDDQPLNHENGFVDQLALSAEFGKYLRKVHR
jgi:hypothetical protein